ncbi:unnamed protein product, partial [marine sediment metagenome]
SNQNHILDTFRLFFQNRPSYSFLSNFTVSYAIRVGLIHFRDLENQVPIEKEEVIAILNELINERVDY